MPQKGQDPVDLSNHGRIACKTRSHVRPEVFFGAEVARGDEEIGNCAEDQMMMESAPGAALIVVESEVGLFPLEVLFDVPARAAGTQAARLSRLTVEVSDEPVIGLSVAFGPVDQKPSGFEIAASAAQSVAEPDFD